MTINVIFEYYFFINNCFNKNSFSVFAQNYDLSFNAHTCKTRFSSKDLFFVPTYNSIRFGRKSIINSSIPFLGIYLQSIYFMTMTF